MMQRDKQCTGLSANHEDDDDDDRKLSIFVGTKQVSTEATTRSPRWRAHLLLGDEALAFEVGGAGKDAVARCTELCHGGPLEGVAV